MKSNDNELSVVGSYGTRALLLASGLIAAGIAATILFSPGAFYESYGIDVNASVALANELRAPAGTLLIAGLLILAGVIKSSFTVLSLATAAAVYLSYGLSRVLSIAIDGVPNIGLVSAAAIELVIGAICFLVLVRHRRINAARQIAA